MNPIAALIIVLGLAMIVIGFKGSQHATLAFITGKGTPAPAPKATTSLPPLPNPQPQPAPTPPGG